MVTLAWGKLTRTAVEVRLDTSARDRDCFCLGSLHRPAGRWGWDGTDRQTDRWLDQGHLGRNLTAPLLSMKYACLEELWGKRAGKVPIVC